MAYTYKISLKVKTDRITAQVSTNNYKMGTVV